LIEANNGGSKGSIGDGGMDQGWKAFLFASDHPSKGVFVKLLVLSNSSHAYAFYHPQAFPPLPCTGIACTEDLMLSCKYIILIVTLLLSVFS
jgi:hypothetical protein